VQPEGSRRPFQSAGVRHRCARAPSVARFARALCRAAAALASATQQAGPAGSGHPPAPSSAIAIPSHLLIGTGAKAEGWIGGAAPRKPAAPGCPAWASAATCAACLPARDRDACFASVKASPYFSPSGGQQAYAAACANLTGAPARATCFRCLGAFGGGSGCAACIQFKGGAIDNGVDDQAQAPRRTAQRPGPLGV
jgi:hypothetical protein